MGGARTTVGIPLARGGEIPATLGRPAGEPPTGGWPGVVVIHEVFGVTPEMVTVVDAFADRGYAALLPDLFARGKRAVCIARAVVESATGQGTVGGDIEAARGWLASRPEVDAHRLGVIGFCMGGGFALAYAATAPAGVRAVSVNYGRAPRSGDALARTCPVVASFGRRDRIYGPHAARLERHLTRLRIDHDVVAYPDAGHSFMTQGRHPIGRIVFLPMRLGYQREAAEDAWHRVFDFFDRHVRGASSG